MKIRSQTARIQLLRKVSCSAGKGNLQEVSSDCKTGPVQI